MRYGSVCSGIEAASVAWESLGWQAAWLAEIEAFPSAVLAHHYPTVPNLGDMTTIAARIEAGEVEAPDLLVGGTPRQSFSAAGLRRSLDDARGNLALSFVELANAIDATRIRMGASPAIVLWENVPGILSTKDNAFGCFLGGLCGADDALRPVSGRWPRAGMVHGRRRRVAWCVLDAQFFGVPQRRRRVFVLASARDVERRVGDGFDPGAVLSIGTCLRGNTPTRGEAVSRVAGTLGGCSPGGGWRLGSDEAAAGQLVAGTLDRNHGNTRADHAWTGRLIPTEGGSVARALTHTGGRFDGDTETFVTHALRADGFDASEDGTGRGTPLVPVTAPCLRSNVYNNSDPSMEARMLVPVMAAGHVGGNGAGIGRDGDPAFTIDTTGAQAIAFHTLQDPIHGAVSPALDRKQAGMGLLAPVAFAENSRAEVRLEGGDGSKVGSLKVGSGKVGSGKVGSGKVGSGKVGSGKVGQSYPAIAQGWPCADSHRGSASAYRDSPTTTRSSRTAGSRRPTGPGTRRSGIRWPCA